MQALLLVAGGGALGSVLRFLISRAVPGAFPYGTLAVNCLGAFAISWLLVSSESRWSWSTEQRLFWVTGVLGGFTTYSAFNHETLALFHSGMRGTALIYVLATLFGAWAMGALGWWVARS